MRHNTRGYEVSYQRDEGFTVRLIKSSGFRDSIVSITDSLCALTGHHFCNVFFDKVETWAYKATTTVLVLPITREQADTLSEPEAWTWLDEDVQEV